MFDLERWHNTEPYSLNSAEKREWLSEALTDLTDRHDRLCPEYHRMLDALSVAPRRMAAIEDVPFLPVRLFKEFSLKSVDEGEISKTMTSSGTTGQQVSKIYLDKLTSANQTKALSKIIASYLGKKRLPMLIIDSDAVLKDRNLFSARGAGILGFSMYGRDRTYALDEDMNLRTDVVVDFLHRHADENVLLFGFTFMVWKHFYRGLLKSDARLDLSRGVLIHGGGWKKLLDEAVSAEEYKRALRDVCGIERVYNYYGMVEQTGSIYMECEYGHLHAPIYSDVVIRAEKDFSVRKHGEDGLIQVLSVLPHSYPGHSLLTEDRGVVLGEDDCPCGRRGKYFLVHGRLSSAEIRGCSDTYAAK